MMNVMNGFIFGAGTPPAPTFSGALVYRSAAFGSGTVGYENEVYDVGSWHDNVTDNSRLTAPSGVSLVRASHNTHDSGVPTLQTLKNGASVLGGVLTNVQDSRSAGTTAFIPMTPTTDYISNSADGDVVADQMVWSAIEAIDPATKYALASKSITQPLSGGVATILSFDSESVDTDGWHGQSSTVTITIASPGVISWTAHGFNNGEPIRFTTTGALPTGLVVATNYYIVNATANDFQLAATPGGAAINTSGTESGVHTAHNDSRMTVPSGVTRIRVAANVQSTSNVSTTYNVEFLKNGAIAVGLGGTSTRFVGRNNIVSALLEVSPGDYLQVQATSGSGQTVTTGNYVWFQINEEPDYDRVLAKKSASQAFASGVAEAVEWDAEEYKTDASMHDNVTDNSRLVVPAGYSYARVTACVRCPSTTAVAIMRVFMNGAQSAGLPNFDFDNNTTALLNGMSGWIPVNPAGGDYFEVIVNTGSVSLTNDVRNSFGMELMP
jgi:hypothetical protein